MKPTYHYCDLMRDWVDFGIGVYGDLIRPAAAGILHRSHHAAEGIRQMNHLKPLNQKADRVVKAVETDTMDEVRAMQSRRGWLRLDARSGLGG